MENAAIVGDESYWQRSPDELFASSVQATANCLNTPCCRCKSVATIAIRIVNSLNLTSVSKKPLNNIDEHHFYVVIERFIDIVVS
jgi:hypothetical protein